MVLNTWIGSLTNTNPSGEGNGGNTVTNIVKGVQNAVNSVNQAVQTFNRNQPSTNNSIKNDSYGSVNIQNKGGQIQNTPNVIAKNGSINKGATGQKGVLDNYEVENGNLYVVRHADGGTYKSLATNAEIDKYNNIIEAKREVAILTQPKGFREIYESKIDKPESKNLKTGYVAINLNGDGTIDTSKYGKVGTYELSFDDSDEFLKSHSGYAKITYTQDNEKAQSLSDESRYIEKLYDSEEERKKFLQGKGEYHTGYINLERDAKGNYKDLDKLGAEGTYLIQDVDNDVYKAVGNEGLRLVTITDKSNPNFAQIGSLMEENEQSLSQGVVSSYKNAVKNIVGDAEWAFGDEYKQVQSKAKSLQNQDSININGVNISNAVLDNVIGKSQRVSAIKDVSTRSTEHVGDTIAVNMGIEKGDANLSPYYQQGQLDLLEAGLTAVGVGATIIPFANVGAKVGTTVGKYLLKSTAEKELTNYAKNKAIQTQAKNLIDKQGKEYIEGLYNLNKLQTSISKPKSIASDLAYAGKETLKEYGSKLLSNPSKKIGNAASFVGITGLNKMGEDNSEEGILTNTINYIGMASNNPFSKIGGGLISGALSLPQFGSNILKGSQKALTGGITQLPQASISGTKELIGSAVSDPYSFYGQALGIGIPAKKVGTAVKKPALKGENLLMGNIQASRIGKVTEQVTKKVRDDYEYALTHGKDDKANPKDFTRIDKYMAITPKEAGKRRKDIYWNTWEAVDATKDVDIAPALSDSLGFSELTISKKLSPETVNYVEKLTAYSNPTFYGTGSGVKFSEPMSSNSYGDMARLSDDIDSAVKSQSKAITDTSLTIINDFINTKGHTKLRKDPEGVGTLYESGHYKDTHIVGDNYGDVEETAVLGDVYGQMSKTPTKIYAPTHNILDFSDKQLIGKVYSETPHSDYRRKTEGALGIKATNKKHLFKKEEITSSTIGYGREGLTDYMKDGKKEAIVQAELQNWKNPANWLLYPASYVKDIGAKLNNIIPKTKEAIYHGTYRMDKKDQKILKDSLEIVESLGLDKTQIPSYDLISDLAYNSNFNRTWKNEPLSKKAKRVVKEVGKFKGNSPLTSQLTIRGMSKDAHRAKDSLDLALESAKRGIFDTYISKHFTKEQREKYVKAFDSMFKEPMFIDEIHQGFLDKMGTINPKYALLLLKKKAISREEYDKNKDLYDKEVGLRKENKEKVKETEPTLDYEGMTDKEMTDLLKEKSPIADKQPSLSENAIDLATAGTMASTSVASQNQLNEIKELRKQMVLEDYYRNLNNKGSEKVEDVPDASEIARTAEVSSMMKGISKSAFESLGGIVKIEKSPSSSKYKAESKQNIFGFEYGAGKSSSGKANYSPMGVSLASFVKYAPSSSSGKPSSPYGTSKTGRQGSKPSASRSKSARSQSSPYSPYNPFKPSDIYTPSSPTRKRSDYDEGVKRNKKRKSTEKYAIMTHTVMNPLSVMGYGGFVDVEQYKEAKGKRVKVNGVITEDFGKMPANMGGMFGVPTARAPKKNKGKAKPSKKSAKKFGEIQW